MQTDGCREEWSPRGCDNYPSLHDPVKPAIGEGYDAKVEFEATRLDPMPAERLSIAVNGTYASVAGSPILTR